MKPLRMHACSPLTFHVISLSGVFFSAFNLINSVAFGEVLLELTSIAFGEFSLRLTSGSVDLMETTSADLDFE